jgi:peroxiredoxin
MSTPRGRQATAIQPTDPDAELTIAASSKAASRALHAGARAPLFTLADAFGRQFALDDALRDGPVVLQFQRGAWCSYGEECAAALASGCREVVALGASVLAIEPPCKRTAPHAALPMPVLQDVNMKVARAYGLAFELPPSLRPRYEQLGYVPPLMKKPQDWLVPLPATYLLDRNGVVILSFIDPDYRNHYSCASLVHALRALQTGRAERTRVHLP